ncbi:hypothetical protein BHE74_00028410 [Ensete ventricosum]|nr:hypothetical protein BHE74_00028410 [Ensete ventricosum]
MATLWKPCAIVTSISKSPSHRSPSSSRSSTIVMASAERSGAATRRSPSAWETRFSLVLALASQASSVSQRCKDREILGTEFPRDFVVRLNHCFRWQIWWNWRRKPQSTLFRGGDLKLGISRRL